MEMDFYSYRYGIGNKTTMSAVAQDADSDFKEEKHPREKEGQEGGGRFAEKANKSEEIDDFSNTVPNPASSEVSTASSGEGDGGDASAEQNTTGWRAHLKGKKISPEMEKVLYSLFSLKNVPDEVIEATPEWHEAMEKEKDLEMALLLEHGVDRTVDIDTPERRDLREAIAEAMLSDTITKNAKIGNTGRTMETNEALDEGDSYKVERGHKAFICMGLPAAGKSTTYANPLALKYKARLCDSDIVKKALPEYEDGFGGNLVHEESKDINAIVLDRAVQRGDNIVYPILGHRPGVMGQLINDLKDCGYEVNLCFKDTPPEVAKGRLLIRYLTKGRYLPLYCISNAQYGVDRSYRQNRDIADNAIRSTNKNPYKTDDRVIDKKGEI